MRNIGNQMSVVIIIYLCAQTIHILLKWHQILCALFVTLPMMHSDTAFLTMATHLKPPWGWIYKITYLAFSLCCCCCRRSLSCQISRVPGLLRPSRVGLEGDRAPGEIDDEGISTWRLDLKLRVDDRSYQRFEKRINGKEAAMIKWSQKCKSSGCIWLPPFYFNCLVANVCCLAFRSHLQIKIKSMNKKTRKKTLRLTIPIVDIVGKTSWRVSLALHVFLWSYYNYHLF